MAVVAISNQKGGVGKTTVTFNLAKGLAHRGYRVLAVDNDPQANLTGALLQNPEKTLMANVLSFYEAEPAKPQQIEENLHLFGADIHLAKVADKEFDVVFNLVEGLDRISDDFDIVLIDCLPSFGYLNMAALLAARWVLIPTKPAPFALTGMKDLFDTIAKVKRPRLNPHLEVIGILLNLVERTNIGRELEQALRAQYGSAVFETTISKGVKMEESPSFGQSIMQYDGEGKAAKQFEGFLSEFIPRISLSRQT